MFFLMLTNTFEEIHILIRVWDSVSAVDLLPHLSLDFLAFVSNDSYSVVWYCYRFLLHWWWIIFPLSFVLFANLDGVQTQVRVKMPPFLQHYSVDQRSQTWTRWKSCNWELWIWYQLNAYDALTSQVHPPQPSISVVKTLLNVYTTCLTNDSFHRHAAFSSLSAMWPFNAWTTHSLIFMLPESDGVSQWFADMSRCP